MVTVEDVERVLARDVNRFLTGHGGAVRALSVSSTGEVVLRFEMACTSCPAQPLTFVSRVYPAVMAIPGVTSVTHNGGIVSEIARKRMMRFAGLDEST